MASTPEPEITIPYIDIRQGTPVDIVKAHKDRAVALIRAGTHSFGWISRAISAVLLPVTDFLSRRWLKKSANPYREEIAACNKEIGVRGIVTLNLSYEWACTTGSYTQKLPDGSGSTALMRTLDWPYPALGETMVVAHQQGPAGDFHNVTWPGLAGVYSAMAKGRFSAAINQAPMRRNWTGVVTDWLRNRLRVNKSRALPPAHLLRKAFETAATYDDAKKMLTTESISIPVIYILAGTKPDEGCVIERLEDKAVVREMNGGKVCASNHFESSLTGNGDGWMARRGCSGERVEQARKLDPSEINGDFKWFTAPIANKFSRLAMVADAARGSLHVIGTVGEKPVTKVFSL